MSKITVRELHEQIAQLLGIEVVSFKIEMDIRDFISQGWTGMEILQAVKYDIEICKRPRNIDKFGISWLRFIREEAAEFWAKRAAREAEANKPNPAVERWLAARLSGEYDIVCNAPKKRTRPVRPQEIDLSKTN